tara:strand:+ start:264 stop:527 length:264 start_codon:yes stop_codon:yes gene_type:complete
MKKENYIVAKVALGTYLFCMGSVLLMNYWAEQTSKHNELLEVQKSVNELRYYVNEDVFNGNLNEEVYEFYTEELYNIEESIKELTNK